MQRPRAAALVLLLTSATVASAQVSAGGHWEFGTDVAAIAFGLKEPFARSYAFGPGIFRAARYLNSVTSLEGMVALHRFAVSGASSNNVGIDVSMLYHLSVDRTKPQLYARPILTWFRDSLAVGGTSSVFGLGAGGGIKVPTRDRRFAVRGEVNYKYTFATGSIFATHTLNLLGGVSAYTR